MALGKTVEELLAQLSSTELLYWQTYYSLEPWGEERADWRNALNCLITANGFGRSKLRMQDLMYKPPLPTPVSVVKAWFVGRANRHG